MKCLTFHLGSARACSHETEALVYKEAGYDRVRNRRDEHGRISLLKLH